MTWTTVREFGDSDRHYEWEQVGISEIVLSDPGLYRITSPGGLMPSVNDSHRVATAPDSQVSVDASTGATTVTAYLARGDVIEGSDLTIRKFREVDDGGSGDVVVNLADRRDRSIAEEYVPCLFVRNPDDPDDQWVTIHFDTFLAALEGIEGGTTTAAAVIMELLRTGKTIDRGDTEDDEG